MSSKVSIKGELYDWLTQTVRITPKAAETYCTILSDANIGSVDRLMRRYDKNKNLLTELNIDEFDAEDIVKALVSAASSPLTTVSEPQVLKTKDPISFRVQHSIAVVPSKWSEKASWDVGGAINVVKFSPDGSVIAVVVNHNILMYYPSGRLITTLESDEVSCLSFSSDGTKLAASSFDKNSVKLFEVSSGRLLWSISVRSAIQVCFFNSSTLIVTEGNSSCAIIDVSSGSITSTIRADGIVGLCVSNKGTLITGGDKGKVTIWDNLNSPRLTFDCSSDSCCMCANSDGSLIYVGTTEGDILVYSDSGLVIGEVKKAHECYVNSVSMNETNAVLVSGGWDKKVKLWNVSTLECIQTLDNNSASIMSVSFSSNNNYFVSGSVDGTIKVWSFK